MPAWSHRRNLCDPQSRKAASRAILNSDATLLSQVPRLDRRDRLATLVSFSQWKRDAGTAVPDLSIEVDDLDEAMNRIHAAGITIEYGPVTEEWGVRRFYVRDPFGKLLNILSHT